MIVEDMLTFQPFFILTQQQLSLLVPAAGAAASPMAETRNSRTLCNPARPTRLTSHQLEVPAKI
jgi:hypothetical protein